MTQAEDYLLRELGEVREELRRTRRDLYTMRYRLRREREQRRALQDSNKLKSAEIAVLRAQRKTTTKGDG